MKILILEDSDADAEMIRRLLLKDARHDYEFTEVDNRADYVEALKHFQPAVILSDNSLPQFDATEALQLLQQTDLQIPFILVTGTVSEEFAAGIIKAGADDYLLKDRLARLPAAIDGALRLKQFEKEKAESEIKIRQNEKRFRSIIENNYDSITLLDASFKTIYRSPSGYRITGWTDEEIQNADAAKFIHPDDMEQSAAVYMECLRSSGKPIKSLTRFLHKNKGYVWMEGTINNLLHDENIKAIVYNFRDVTDRVEAEAKLKDNEEKLRSIVENITDILCTHDLEGNVSFVNMAAKHNLGYEIDEMLTMNIKDILLPESKEKFDEYLQYILEHGTAGSVIHVQTKAGEHRIWKFRNSLKTNGTNPPLIHGFAKDVTEKIKAEEKLTQSEKLFRALVENNEGIISMLDENMRTVFRSVSATRITGWTDEEFEKVSPQEYFHPDDINNTRATTAQALANPGQPIPVSIRVRHKQGHFISLEGVINNMRHDPSIGYIVINLRDITARKKAEKKLFESESRFRALVENNDGIITLQDSSLKTIFRSSSAYRITGWSNEDFDQMPLRELMHPDDIEALQQTIGDSFSKPGVTVPVCFRIKHKQGHYVWLEGVMINLINDTAIGGIVSNLNDVTERKLSEKILKEERDKFAIITATAPGLIYSFQLNTDGTIGLPYVSEHSISMWGFSKEEVLKNADVVLRRWHPDDIEPQYQDILSSAKNLTPWRKEFRYNHPTKGLVWLLGNSMPVAQPDGSTVWHGIITDITERKDAEKKILKANRLYLFISQINQMIVRTTDEVSLFKEACKIAVDCGKFKMVWIGKVDEVTRNIIPVEHIGEEQEYLSSIKAISVDDVPQGQGPVGRAAREGTFIVCNDIENDKQMAPWKDAAIIRGYRSLISIPIKKSGNVTGVFNFYSGEKNFFDAEEIELLIEAAGDVSFALDNFEKEAARKKAEGAVAESEERYQTLTETSPVGIFHTDAEGSTTYVNPCWCSISGLTIEQALGNGWLSAVHPDDREKLNNVWNNEVLAHHQSLSEYRFVRQDGSIAWVIGQAIPEKNANGNVVGYVGTITDVTEHREAEEIILKEKNLTDKLINNLPGIFYLYDTEGNFIRWNKNFEDASGFSSNEIKNMRPLDFYEDNQKEKIATRIKTVFEKSVPGIEVEMLKKDKTTIPFFINSLKINYEGKECLLGMGLDLTEKRKAEKEIKEAGERYELIGKATNDGVWDWDVETGKVWANEMHQQLYGLTIADAVPDYEEWLSRIHPDEKDRTEKLLDKAKASDSESFVDEYRFFSATKGWVNIFSRIFIERNAAGKAIRLIGSMVDITERKTAEEKLNEKNVQLQSLSDNLPGVMLFQLTGGPDGNRKFNYVSNGSLLITGKTPQEIINDPAILYNAIVSEDLPLMIAAEVDSFNNFKVFNVEVRSRNHKGEIRWLNIISSPRKLSNGSLVWDGFHVDITDRKLADEATRKSKESLEHAEELALLGSWEIDSQNKSSKWSKQMFRLFEFDEAYGMPSFTDYLEKIHIDDRAVVEENLQKMIDGVLPDTVGIFRTNNEAGSLRFLQPSYRVFKNSQGEIIKFTGTIQDITERIVYENQLMASEEKYRVLVEQASDGIFIADESGRFIMVNSSATKLSGYSAAELENLSIYNLVHPASILAEPFKFEDMLRPQGARSERKMLKKDGSSLDVEINAKFLPDKRFIAFIRDISERKKIAEEIKASEEKYRVLVEEASEGIYISDKTGRFVTVNASACRLAQHTEEELLAMSIYDFFVDDDLKARPPQFEALKQGKTVVSERIMKRKDGNFNHLEITSKLLTDGRLLSLVRDVADRKKAEEAIRLSNERYNLVAKATNDSIWDLDIVTGEISRTGEGFKTLFGYDAAASVHTDPEFSTLVHPDDLSSARASMVVAFENPDVFYWAEEYRLLKANGEYAHVYDKGYIIRDENGKAIRMIGATQDITNLKENEINLKKLNDDLHQQAKALADSNAELEQFAYVASHDLQEPLRMVTSFLTLLELNYAAHIDDKGKEYIHFAVDGAKRMRQIILDLLEISRVGRTEDNLELIDLNLLVGEILQLLQKQVHENDAVIEIAELPVLYAYRSPLMQVFQNLVGNSIKYTRKGVTPQIKISVEETPQYWQFSIADNGIGIEPEYFNKIFVIFQRLHNQNEFSGTGIGLAISKKIIENLGGKIWLESEPEKGSTFYFTIKK